MNLNPSIIVTTPDLNTFYLDISDVLSDTLSDTLSDDDMPDLISVDNLVPNNCYNDCYNDCYNNMPDLVSSEIILNEFDDDLPDLEYENTLQQVKDEIESTVNFPSMDEGLNALDISEILLARMQTAFDQFKNKIGRNMTYSEMRQMMG